MLTPPARQDSGSGNTPGLISMVVDEALHEGFGPAKHTTYRLTTTLKKTSTTSTCRKRFSHFIALRAAMVEAKPGLVIPPLPEKSVMNRFESDFVEDRRLMLEVFLNRVVNHPVAVLLPALAQFLGWKEDICTIVNAEMGSFVLPRPQAPIDGADPLKGELELAKGLEQCIVAVRTVLKRMNSRQQETGMDYLEMAQTMQALGDNSMNITLRPSLVALAEGSHELAGMTKRRAEGNKQSLVLVLKTYQLMAQAIQEQLKRRAELQRAIDKAGEQLKEVQQQSIKLQVRG